MTLKAGESIHYLFEASGCECNLKDKDLLESFINKLPEQIGMKLIQPARMVHCDAEDQIDMGYSGVAILAESHCSFHAFHNRKYIMLDVFSCCEFNEFLVREKLITFLRPKNFLDKVEIRGHLMDDYKKAS